MFERSHHLGEYRRYGTLRNNNAIPGQINISAETYRLVAGQFKCTYRGEVEVKNKGKMGMYVVEQSQKIAV